MIKKLVLSLILLLIFATLIGLYFNWRQARQQREEARIARENAKAPEESITIIEGWSNQDIAEYLEKRQLIKAQDFLSAQASFDASGYPILASRPAKADLEGFLFPDTYRILKPKNFNDPATSEAVINKMLNNFSVKFTPSMESQAKKQQMSVFEIITLASVIENETGRNATSSDSKAKLDTERITVSGIFYNRLRIGLALQSDATINYITKKNTPSPSAEDLEANSPYNTYKYEGLPPGPISNPSLSSIMAALYPAATDYLYFLHKQPSGEPVYSKTFEEHIMNKQKYLK